MLERIIDISFDFDLTNRFSVLKKIIRYFFAFRLDISNLPHSEQKNRIVRIIIRKFDKKPFLFYNSLAINGFHA